MYLHNVMCLWYASSKVASFALILQNIEKHALNVLTMTSSLDTYRTVLLFGTNTLEDELSLHYDLHLQVAPVTLPYT